MDTRARKWTAVWVAAAAGALAYVAFAEGGEAEPADGQAGPQVRGRAMPLSEGDAGCAPAANHHCPRLEPTLR
jgi:hypothetical protein